MSTRYYYYSEACCEFHVTEIEEKDGVRFVGNKFVLDWYNGKTNIPRVSRKEKPKGTKQ